jgi:hypothetical protein
MCMAEQSQGSIERANFDINKMIATWMRENQSLKWKIACKFVQLQKNHSHHTGNKCTPYKAVFGIETPMSLDSTDVPKEEWSKLESATDLFKLLGIQEEFDSDQVEYFTGHSQ